MMPFLNPMRLVHDKKLADKIGSRKSFIFGVFSFVGAAVSTYLMGFTLIGVLGWSMAGGLVGGLFFKALSYLDTWANFGNSDRNRSHSHSEANNLDSLSQYENVPVNNIELENTNKLGDYQNIFQQNSPLPNNQMQDLYPDNKKTQFKAGPMNPLSFNQDVNDMYDVKSNNFNDYNHDYAAQSAAQFSKPNSKKYFSEKNQEYNNQEYYQGDEYDTDVMPKKQNHLNAGGGFKPKINSLNSREDEMRRTGV